MGKEKFDTEAFKKYYDLDKMEWFYFKNSIYFTNNVIKPAFSREVWWSYLLRKLGLKSKITLGKPKEIKY